MREIGDVLDFFLYYAKAKRIMERGYGRQVILVLLLEVNNRKYHGVARDMRIDTE